MNSWRIKVNYHWLHFMYAPTHNYDERKYFSFHEPCIVILQMCVHNRTETFSSKSQYISVCICIFYLYLFSCTLSNRLLLLISGYHRATMAYQTNIYWHRCGVIWGLCLSNNFLIVMNQEQVYQQNVVDVSTKSNVLQCIHTT